LNVSIQKQLKFTGGMFQKDIGMIDV